MPPDVAPDATADAASDSVDEGDADAAGLDGVDAGPDAAELWRVFAHSPTALYRIDVAAQEPTKIADFTPSGVGQVIDLAVDRAGRAFVTTFGGLYAVDLYTAEMTQIALGSYPNSLSFVPRGTIDANEEVLVGYVGSTYVRIDTQIGAVRTVGSLGATGYVSSGDLVSLADSTTYLTVKGPSCLDCLVRVDPSTGVMLQNYGSIGYADLYGVGYAEGVLYGFTGQGEALRIGFGQAGLEVSELYPRQSWAWWGAGSTTAATRD